MLNKVCLITTSDSPLDGRVFYKQAKSLKEFGLDVTVIAPSRKNKTHIIDEIRVMEVKDEGLRLLRWFLLSFRILEHAKNVNADIYQCINPTSFFLAILLKMQRKKVIYEVREYYPDVIPITTFPLKVYLSLILTIFEPIFCKYFDAIITTDNDITKRYKKFNSETYTIFNYPSFNVFKLSEDYGGRNENKDNHVIIYVGALSENRGIFKLIEAIHQVFTVYPYVKLQLVGWFVTEEFRVKCQDYVKQNKLEQNIEFIGKVPIDFIPEYIFSADIGAVLLQPIPKFYKNIPTKQFEYMFCAKPIIGSNLPPIATYVGESKSGIIVDPTDVNEIANSIIYLIENPDVANTMGLNGRNAVLKTYNWNKEENKFIKIYDEILSEL